MRRYTFLSTPSGWRATAYSENGYYAKFGISIHALRVEGDADRAIRAVRHRMDFYPRPPGGGRHLSGGNCSNLLGDFYPRPPGGGRLDLWEPTAAPEIFLSTPSGWRATTKKKTMVVVETISIHALRVEGDLFRRWSLAIGTISIHALRVEGD